MRKKHSVMLIAVLAMILCLTMAFGITAYAEEAAEAPAGNTGISVGSVANEGYSAPASGSVSGSLQTDNAPQDNAPAQEAPVQEVPQAEQTTPASDAPVEEAQQNEQEPGQEPAPEADVTETELPTQPIDEEPSQEPVEETATEPAEQQQDEENPAGEEPANTPPAGEEPVNADDTPELPGAPAPAEEPTVELPEGSSPELSGEKMEITPVAQFTGADGTIKSLEVGGSAELKEFVRSLGYEGEIESAISSNPQAFDVVDGQLVISEPFGDETLTLVIDGQEIVIPVHDPAKVNVTGETEYSTINAAFDLQNNYDAIEITLTGDCEVANGTLEVKSEKSVTLDLNGFKLKGTGEGSVIKVNGTFTLRDSNGTGEITGNGNDKVFDGLVQVEEAGGFGAAIKAGGEIKLAADIPYKSTAAVTIVGETTIDLNGHTLNITTTSATRYSIKVGTSSNDCDEVLTIKDSGEDGILNVTNQYTLNKSYLFEVYGTLNIQGGTINQTASKASSYGINMQNSGTFKMSGGKLNKGTSLDTTGYTLRGSSGTIIITGGVIEDYYAGNNASGWEVSGGVFKTQPTYEMMKAGKISYKITDGGTYNNWYGVKEGTYVGLVGPTAYTDVDSFANAIGSNKITVDGTKLTLTGDINLGNASANKVTFLSDITLDLAGHNITGNFGGVGASSAYMLYVNNKDATVQIIGKGTVKSQLLNFNPTNSTYIQTIGVNKGTLIVDNATIEAYVNYTDSSNIKTTYLNIVSLLTADAKVVMQNKAQVYANCNNTVTQRASVTGIVLKNGTCEIDDSTISITTGTGAKGIESSSNTGTMKIGSKNTGKTTIEVTGLGLNAGQVVTHYGISGSSSSGAKGNVFIANAEIKINTSVGNTSKAQSCYGIKFNEEGNGTYEIGDNVSVFLSGTSAGSPEAHGICVTGGGTISGSNVSIVVNCENASKRYGIDISNSADFKINPGTNVTININKGSISNETNYVTYASSTGRIRVADGTYSGGTLSGMLATGGVFDRDPSAVCDFGYVAQENAPEEGLWLVVPDTRKVVKNVTQSGTEYGSILAAVEAANKNDELQLIDDINYSSADLTITDISLDLNGHSLGLNKLNTSGNVTITDKKATSYSDAGTLTASVNAGVGSTLITKINHTCEISSNPLIVKGTSNADQATLTINGIKGVYSGSDRIVSALNYGIVNVNDSIEGFETDLALTFTSGAAYIFGGNNTANNITINGGKFFVGASTAGYAFQAYANALVKNGKFTVTSINNGNTAISNSNNANIDIEFGYFVGKNSSTTTDKTTFFAKATKLSEDGKNPIDLAESNPMYAEGYRYTVGSQPVAKIGDTTYSSVQKAIDAASDGDTITLLDNSAAQFGLTLNKNVTFEGDYKVTLSGEKPLTLGAGIEKPDCFDGSSAILYIQKKSGEKVYYSTWITYDTPNTGAIVDYDSEVDEKMVLTKDRVVGSSMSIYKTCTIDLNGFSIIGKNCTYQTLDVRNNKTICTIIDSSEGKTGKITGNNDGYYTVQLMHDGTRLILESGTIENTGNGSAICAIGDNYNLCKNTIITINGGEVKAKNNFAIVDNGQYSQNITININGGKITSTDSAAIYHPASGTMTLNGGTISGNTGIYIRSGSLVVPKESTVKVHATGTKGTHNPTYSGGAEMTGDAVVICETAYPGGTVSADIAGGAFYSENAFAVASYANTGLTAIKGFLKGGIYGANQERIDIMDVDDAKDLIAAGYIDIPNEDAATNNDHPWRIAKPLGDDAVQEIPEQKYTGKEVEPEIVVIDAATGIPLVAGTDFDVTYEDNTEPGKALAVITLKGNYTGTLNKAFTIGQKPMPSPVPPEKPQPQKEEKQITVPVSDGNTVNIRATVNGNTVEVKNISAYDISTVLNSENATKEIKVDCSEIAGVESTKVNLQLSSLKSVAGSEANELKVIMNSGSVTMGKDALTYVTENAKGSSVTLVIEDAEESNLNEAQKETIQAEEKLVAVIDTYILSDSAKLKELGGNTVTLTMSDTIIRHYDPVTLHVIEIRADGTRREISFRIEDGKIVFDADYLSTYMIVRD